MAVVLIGTLDTKGRELAFVRDEIRRAGLETLVVDAGWAGPPLGIMPDLDRRRVFRPDGAPANPGDRASSVAEAAEGVGRLVVELDREGRVDGVLAVGGSAGTTIGTAAMRALPFGVPKVMVSTLASGAVGAYVGGSDVAMFHPVADVAGLNRLTRVALGNAAHAMVGMVRGRLDPGNGDRRPLGRDLPLVVASMFGVTTPCVDRARASLEASGAEVVVFHATGTGGRAMEGLVRDGLVDAMLDLTTTEIADEIVGGVLSAGPDRLLAATRAGTPRVVSLGALDMVNFGPRETVPDRFRDRLFHAHDATVTLMRTTPDESAAIGRRIGEALARSTGPTALLIPLRGLSALDAPGRPFRDPAADAALFDAIRSALAGSDRVAIVERDEHINDPSFAEAAAETLRGLLPAPGSKGPSLQGSRSS